MTLTPGSKLGPYEIQALVGAGGMGEVYRAHDERLGRDVAVKMLPPAFSSDPDRLRRFEQEARAAGMLNHPNILAIYDIGMHEESPYVVSELLEGETLRQLLDKGPLPAKKCIDYARQAVSGLAAAHEKGIVHRDLKPENLFITRDGWVKLLDFGLAKLIAVGNGNENDSLMATMADTTQPGAVLGTVGYMSPEQVRGQTTDHRSDIFSFGAIFYEMLTGNRAFKGNSAVETMSAILTEEPSDIAGENRAIAPAVEQIVRHCLEKNPDERFQSARDLGFHLDAVTGIATPSEAVLPLAARLRRRSLWPWLLPALAVLLLASAFTAGQVFRIPRLQKEAARALGRVSVALESQPLFEQVTFRRGTVFQARFAPDGETIYYGAAWDGKPFELFSTRVKTLETRSILAEAEILAISSRGELAILLARQSTAQFSWTGTLARLPMDGGAPQEVLEGVQFADWSPDGQSLAVARRSAEKTLVEFPIGKVLHETSGVIGGLRVSPQGDAVALLERPLGISGGWSLVLVETSRKKTELFRGWTTARGLAWSPGGAEMWVAGSQKELDAPLFGFTRAGGRRMILRVPGAVSLYDVSKEHRVLLGQSTFRTAIVAQAPGESRERDLSWFGNSLAADFSLDGRTLLFSDAEGDRPRSIFLRKTDGSPAVRLGEGYPLALTPDGNFAVGIPASPVPQLALLPTGPGERRNIVNENMHEYSTATVFDGGQRLLFAAREQGRGFRIYVQNIDAPAEAGKPRAITPEGVGATAGQPGSVAVSPDGQWVAASDGNRLRLYSTGAAEAREIPGLEGGELPVRWGDTRTLYVYRPTEVPARIFRVDVASGKKQLVKELAPVDPAGVMEIMRVLISPGADAYAYSYARLMNELYVVDRLQ